MFVATLNYYKVHRYIRLRHVYYKIVTLITTRYNFNTMILLR